MAGIAGILKSNERKRVEKMLSSISHRGGYGKKIFRIKDATIGMVWSKHEDKYVKELTNKMIFRDGSGFGHCAEVLKNNEKWELHRDELGTAPLYYAHNDDQPILFASEVKALLPFSKDVMEILPGHILSDDGLKQNFKLERRDYSLNDYLEIADELRAILKKAIKRRVHSETMGAWLSGGVDSSTIAALVRPQVSTLHTFAGGLKDAPDIQFAKEVADYIGSEHHEVIIDLEGILRILPDVIYQLESFDALLVRSSIINLSVAYAASNYVSEVFSGEGGDELFAGYEYMKEIPLRNLDDELIDISNRLHNTALQRVDRSASAFGTTAHTIFTDPEVFEFAMRIPAELKIKHGIDKWILRLAMNNLLPERIITRTKAKFWEGSGVGSLLKDYVTGIISDWDFAVERNLKNGWILNSKEELFYYRIFKQHFGELENLLWMGRTKGIPIL